MIDSTTTLDIDEIVISSTGTSDKISICDNYDCIAFPVQDIDKIVSALLKLKEEK